MSTKARKIPAFYAGVCRACKRSVAKGTEIFFRKHFGMRCVACGPHTDADERLPSKSTKTPPAPPLKPKNFTPAFEVPCPVAQCGADGVHRIEYGSVREIVEASLSAQAQSLHNQELLRAIQSQELTGKSAWANYFTRQTLLAQVFNPAPDLRHAVERMRSRLEWQLELPVKPRRRLRRGQEWGNELDPERWLMRDPNGWERIEKQAEVRRTITIGCNLSVIHRVQPEQLLYRGAAALALADHLTARGCNVGIALFQVADQITSVVDKGLVRCDVKAPDAPLDLSGLVFALCEIAFYRCALVLAAARRWPGTLHKNLGKPAALPASERASVDYLIDTDVLGEDAALEWLRRQLNVEVNSGHSPRDC